MVNALLLAVAVVAQASGYYTSMAEHLRRYLAAEGVNAQTFERAKMDQALAHERIVFLVGGESVSAAEMAALRGFRARGGKLVVFNGSASALAELMGVKCVGYRAAAQPGEFSRMDFTASAPAGVPRTIRQQSLALQRARPLAGRSRTIATWTDRAGRSTGEPAWIESEAGWWMTQVLTSEGDEDAKGRLAAALCGAVDPRLWSLAAHNRREEARHQATLKLARSLSPRPGEIHAVWDHGGTGLYPGDWPRTLKALAAAHVTDLYLNVAGFGFAHYPSRVLPVSKTARTEGDQLAAALAAAKGTGVRVHAWILCFSAARSEPDVLKDLAARGWRLKDGKGKLTEYVDPANAAVRARILSALDELVGRYPALAGVQLDFVRYGDTAVKPPRAAAVITDFVRKARAHVPKPRMLTAAVYGKHPQCVASVGQDWPAWLDAGLVDYAVPMDYTAEPAKFEELLALQGPYAARTVVGIGVTANESRLDAAAVLRQLQRVRRGGFAGAALFDLDVTLEKNILPYLKAGIW